MGALLGNEIGSAGRPRRTHASATLAAGRLDDGRDGYKCGTEPIGVRSAMLDFLRFARDFVADLLRPRTKLVAENALLRQQLIVAERKIVGRPRWRPWERYTMALAARFTPA